MNDALVAPRRSLGRYEILGEIARGAMGVVYKARDPLIDRLVAIKTVDIGLSAAETEAFERRFFREAKSAGRLNHPNVVTIHDVGKSDDVAYIAMEFLDGRSLREILDSGVVLAPQRVADIAAEIAEGLAFAHRNGVVHRDVKPANIMVLHSGAVKITDFGIALLPTGTRTLAGNVFGSPRYTSPEQVMGRTVDGRSDIFSLGAVVYEMLTGKPPFAGGDLNTILKQVLSEPTPPPSSHNPKLPRAFDHIVGKALAKDPNDRYQDAQQLADELRHFDTIEFDSAAPSPLPALEHPTTPFEAPPLEALEVHDTPLLPAPQIDMPPPHPAGAWWKAPRIAVVAAAIAVVIAAGAMIGLRSASDTPPTVVANATGTSGTIAPPAPERAVQPLPPPPPLPVLSPEPAPTATTPPTPAAVAASTPSVHTPPSPPKPTGRVALAIAPWGEVYVDGRKRGLSPPMKELRLPPGTHTIEVRNGAFEAHRESVDVTADGAVSIRHTFR